MDESHVGHKWGMGGMHGVYEGACMGYARGWGGGIKRAIGLTGSPGGEHFSPGGEHQTRRAIPSNPLHLLSCRYQTQVWGADVEDVGEMRGWFE